MFERFTDRARRVVVFAQEEARMLGHDFIGTEHLLLGLMHEDEGVAAQALKKSVRSSLTGVRHEIQEIIGPGEAAPTGHTPMPFTPRSKKVLELSLREALQLGHNYIGTEHILLGLIREGEGVAAQVLQKLGADLNQVRRTVIELLSGFPGGKESAPGEAPPSRAELPDEHPGEPSCGMCGSELASTLRRRTLDVADEEQGDSRTVTVLFCSVCGTTIGVVAE